MSKIKDKHSTTENDTVVIQKKKSILFSILVLVLFFLLLVMCTVLQFLENKRNAVDSCTMMVEQIKELITENENSLRELQETLKEEYLVRADNAADHLEHVYESFNTSEDFARLAERIQVDEINIFDKDGIIINGSVPQYFGLSMNSGEQMSYFLPMLSDTELTMCQDVTPNTAEGKSMMYAMVWNSDKTAIVQVGVTPDRLIRRMKNNDISHLVSRLPMIKGMSAFVADEETGQIVGSTDKEMIGYYVRSKDRQEEIKEGNTYVKTVRVRNKMRYLVLERMGKYEITVSFAVTAANESIFLSVFEFTVIMTAAFLILIFLVRRYTAFLERQGQELSKANRAKTDFLRRMSHDIRTPLNGIRGVVKIASHYPDDTEKQTECREKVMKASDFLLELVNNVLNMNKLESGVAEPEIRPFDLAELLSEVNGILEMQGEEYAVAVTEDVDSVKNIHLVGSSLYLKQVLLNIGGNAVKYSHSGGRVRLTVRELSYDSDKTVISFACKDTGRGMSEDFVKHAFEPFLQENSDARTNYSGTGLGLAITKQMVELMNGTISIESELGVGTTVSVTVPFEIDKNYNECEDCENVADSVTLEGINVLLAEDNKLNAEIAKFFLEKCGMNVSCASNGREATEMFKNSETGYFSVVLMDIMMPEMDGLAAAREIRSLDRDDADTVAIFAMTANSFKDDIRESILAGMNEHLSKPINEKELIDAIKKYVKR